MNKYYSVCYGIIALPLVIFLAYFIPAFQAPDEYSHFVKSYQVYSGDVLPKIIDDGANKLVGGTSNRGILEVSEVYSYLIQNPENHVTKSIYEKAYKIQWQEDYFSPTANTSTYPPILYAASSLGIAVAKNIGMNVEHTLKTSRLLNGILAVLIIMVAIYICRIGVELMFVILLLPMTLAQISSTSQDSMLISLSALAASLMTYIFKGIGDNSTLNKNILLIFLVLIISLISITRPPYIALSLFFVAFAMKKECSAQTKIYCIVSFIMCSSITFFWFLYLKISGIYQPPTLTNVSPYLQINYILNEPIDLILILFHTLKQNLFKYSLDTIGIIGHFDTIMPPLYYIYALVMLFYSVAFYFKGTKKYSNTAILKFLIALTPLAVSFFGILIIMYLSWTEIQAPVIDGVQGRYFIPILLFFPVVFIYIYDKTIISPPLKQRKYFLLYSMITALVIAWVIINRYYV